MDSSNWCMCLIETLVSSADWCADSQSTQPPSGADLPGDNCAQASANLRFLQKKRNENETLWSLWPRLSKAPGRMVLEGEEVLAPLHSGWWRLKTLNKHIWSHWAWTQSPRGCSGSWPAHSPADSLDVERPVRHSQSSHLQELGFPLVAKAPIKATFFLKLFPFLI